MRIGWVLALAGCGGGVDETPFAYVPALDYPPYVTVVQGGSTSFVLSTTDFSHGGVGILFYSMDKRIAVSPPQVDLSPGAPSALAMITTIDAPAPTFHYGLELYVPGSDVGSSPFMGVSILDPNQQNILASAWSLMMSPASTTSFTVQLAQPPMAPLDVALESLNLWVASVNPATMTFTSTDYNLPQTAIVTSMGSGSTDVTLTSSSLGASVAVDVQ